MVSLLLLPLVSELERARTMSCSLLVCPEKALHKYRHEQKVNEQICYLMCGSKEKQLACLTDFSDGAQVGPRKNITVAHNLGILRYVTSQEVNPLLMPSNRDVPDVLLKSNLTGIQTLLKINMHVNFSLLRKY